MGGKEREERRRDKCERSSSMIRGERGQALSLSSKALFTTRERYEAADFEEREREAAEWSSREGRERERGDGERERDAREAEEHS